MLSKKLVIQQLQREVLSLQQRKRKPFKDQGPGRLGLLESSFPDHTFPLGGIHEFVSQNTENAAATTGFIIALLSILFPKSICLWISNRRTVFPPALDFFHFSPEQIIFIDTSREKDALWAIEEALQCPAVPIVVGEISALSFMQSRRLQLAMEKSVATGFLHRHQPRQENTIACLSKWNVRVLPSQPKELPGVGLPRWEISLMKVRNGKPGIWHVEWSADGLRYLPTETEILTALHTKTA